MTIGQTARLKIRRAAGPILLSTILTACGSTDSAPTAPGGPGSPSTPDIARLVEIHSGDNQRGAPNEALREPLVVRVTDSEGLPISDVLVMWRVIEGDGEIPGPRVPIDGAPSDAVESHTNHLGLASALLSLGPLPGRNTAEARTLFSDAVTFRATADR